MGLRRFPVPWLQSPSVREFMKRRIWVTRLLQWFSLFVFVAPGFAGQAPVPQPSAEEARVFKIFTARVQQYVKLQKNVEASLPA